MKTYAIVVIYNGLQKDWVKKCFNSLLESSIPINIIAIDNVSTDGSVDFIKQNYPSVELIINDANLGFGKANNIGIKRALDNRADFLFLLNQDAWVQKETVETLIKSSKKNPEYGILSPLHMNGIGDLIDSGFYHCINPWENRQLYSYLYRQSFDKETLIKVDFVPAAAWLMPKNTIENIGGFNPSFFHYGEDNNYAHRILYHNLKIGIVPAVEIYHDREERPAHIYYNNILIEYERKVTLYVSNPLLKGNWMLTEYRFLFIDLFTEALFLNGKAIKFIYNKFRKLTKIKSKTLLKNKKASMLKGKSFLE